MEIIVFPRSKPKNNNEEPLVKNTEIAPTSTAPNEINEQHQHIAPLVPNSVNISAFIVNQTAIDNELKPIIYIDDDGIFQVKYIPKGANVSISNVNQPSNFTSINKTDEIAIVSNGNRPSQTIQWDHYIQSETNPHSTSPTTIDLFHRGPNINRTETELERHETHTKTISFEQDQQKEQQTKQQQQQEPQQQQQQQLVSDTKHPRLFNELPIFV